MGVGETITVINKSGKVVSSSKHLVSVFKEAKAAYRERKAEIKAERDAVLRDKKIAEDVKNLKIDDDVQSRASHRTHRSSKSRKHSSHHDGRPGLERGYTDSFYANDAPPNSKHRFEQELADLDGEGQAAHRMELTRRNTATHVQRSTQMSRSRSVPNVDLDLAYGDIPPPLPAKRYNDEELKEKASKITMLLEEANCLQHTVAATIDNLQKNPEALAAVSLTLAEISAIVGKMGPGILTALKGSFPAVAALLLSPQFMIAGGVAVGVTIVALGGYKIIKKIQAQADEAPVAIPMAAMPAGPAPVAAAPAPMALPATYDNNELDELEPQELSRVEMWRRGIADVEASSVGTSVDGELITPEVSRQLCSAGILDEDDLKSRRSTRSRKNSSSRSKSHRAKSEVSVKTEKTSKTEKTEKTEKTRKTEKSSRTNKTDKTSKTSDSKRSKPAKEGSTAGSTTGSSKKKEKEKEPSGLKMLFRAHTLA